MIATVRNFGEGLGVQFPKFLLKNMQIFENDDVEILVGENHKAKKYGKTG